MHLPPEILLPTNQSKRLITLKSVEPLLLIRVTEPVPAQEKGWGIYATTFTVPRNTGDWHMILGLKFLNKFIKIRHFHMKTIQWTAEALQKREFLISVDLTWTYLHIPIASAHRCFLKLNLRLPIFPVQSAPLQTLLIREHILESCNKPHWLPQGEGKMYSSLYRSLLDLIQFGGSSLWDT